MTDDLAAAIEAILMVAEELVPPQLLAQLLEVPPARVDELCAGLAAAYEADGRGFELRRVGGGYRFQSHPDQAAYVERFVLEGQSARLSAAALEEVLPNIALLLAPFAPYTAEDLWEKLGRQGPVLRVPWPKFDPALAAEDEAEVVLQVNGKLRSRLLVPRQTPQEQLERLALADPKVQAFVNSKQIVKVVVVPDKLVNVVVR